jgi:aminopeptidase N/puromycin-sensitive aminopeptidase
LPNSVLPDHYQLGLDIDIQGRTFSGEETIHVRTTQPVSEVILNSLDLEIASAEVTAGTSRQRADVTQDKTAETIRLLVPTAVPAGDAELHLKFSGRLAYGLRGLYLSRTPRRSYAVTQFEGTYARMMFPSFDEPAFKATFDLSVVIDAGDTAISNGRIVRDEALGTRHRLTFSTSPRMSTYLLALAVGDWQCTGRTVSEVPIRVCAIPEKKSITAFPLQAAARSLEFYNRWYGIKYPFGKLDMLAIPDYEWGGMENTAAIFYRDTALLLDEEQAPVSSKRGRATLVAHEIAHQWFGDLVTPAWWDDIWLNEGFATWMARRPVEDWHPEWLLDEDATASAQSILAVDSLASARAIHGDPRTSSDIKEMFDGITYQKGAAVLRMLEAYVGPEVFRRGVNQYLEDHAFGNASSSDFWKAMSRVSGKPVDKIMQAFVMQPGAPLIRVTESCQHESTRMNLQQQRFYLSSQGPPADSHPLWQIPICVQAEPGKLPACTVLADQSQDINVPACPAWIFANPGGKGYYRTLYEPQTLQKIALAAEKSLTPEERITFLEDAWAMTRAGRYPVETFMTVAEALRGDHNLRIVDLLADHLESLAALVPEGKQSTYKQFLRKQFEPLAQELGWNAIPGEDEDSDALRARVLEILGKAGDPAATQLAQKIVASYLRQPGTTDPALTGPAFEVIAAHGGPALYDKLSSGLSPAAPYDEYYVLLYAMAKFPEPALVQRNLDLVSQGKLRQQDYARFFSVLLEKPASQNATWSYMKAHWSDLAEKVTSFGGRGAVTALENFCSSEQRDNIKQFFAAHPAPGAERAVRRSLEQISSCLAFRDLQQQNMAVWLNSQ